MKQCRCFHERQLRGILKVSDKSLLFLFSGNLSYNSLQQDQKESFLSSDI
jgi:hypothetical protein